VNKEKYNRVVCKIIGQQGTFEGEQIDGRIFYIEANEMRGDGSIENYIGWHADNHSAMTIAKTPYDVIQDLP
tara:strand:+ start:434 stop:649 length:216 start_codon:yes stop_codon:yes gene_type:complete